MVDSRVDFFGCCFKHRPDIIASALFKLIFRCMFNSYIRTGRMALFFGHPTSRFKLPCTGSQVRFISLRIRARASCTALPSRASCYRLLLGFLLRDLLERFLSLRQLFLAVCRALPVVSLVVYAISISFIPCFPFLIKFNSCYETDHKKKHQGCSVGVIGVTR